MNSPCQKGIRAGAPGAIPALPKRFGEGSFLSSNLYKHLKQIVLLFRLKIGIAGGRCPPDNSRCECKDTKTGSKSHEVTSICCCVGGVSLFPPLRRSGGQKTQNRV